ncbi:MAG: phosphatase PAP2 family protein [Limisphaerales bacterium]
MLRKIALFVLHRRLEDVLAVGFSLTLLLFFLTRRVFRPFQFSGHDVTFLLLPIGVLGVKCLFELLLAPEADGRENPGLGKYLASFFRPLARIFRDWCPFLLLSACYFALYSNLMLRVNPHTVDAALSGFDAALLGDQPSFLLEKWVTPWATDFFNLIYFSYVLSLPLVAFWLYTTREKSVFRRVMMGYLTLMLLGITGYLCMPAIGPAFFFSDRYAHDLNGHALIRGVDYIMRNGHVAYDCFPSLHVGIPLLLCFYLRDYQRKLFIPALLYVLTMSCAVIYLRYHYVADVLAAFIFAPAAYGLNDFMLSRWPGERIIAAAGSDQNHDIPANAEPT